MYSYNSLLTKSLSFFSLIMFHYISLFRFTHYIKIHMYTRIDFPCGSEGREFTFNAEDLGSIPGLGKSP